LLMVVDQTVADPHPGPLSVAVYSTVGGPATWAPSTSTAYQNETCAPHAGIVMSVHICAQLLAGPPPQAPPPSPEKTMPEWAPQWTMLKRPGQRVLV